MIATPCCLVRTKGYRKPELLVATGELEMRRHHADDRIRLRVERQALPDDPGVAIEAPLPQAMTEHDHALGLRAVFLGGEDAPQSRGDPEQREQACRNTHTLDPLRLATPSQAHA